MDLDLRELQGNIFRSYGSHYRVARHLVLSVVDPAAARAALAAMVDGSRDTPEITRADIAPRHSGFEWCLNVGMTYRGLAALGVPGSSLDTFPPEFREGMVARAARLGDVGASDPRLWIAGLGDAERVHLIVSIHGREGSVLDRIADQVLAAGGGRAFAPAGPSPLPDGEAFLGEGHERRVHFGYVDGISQPRFEGVHDHASAPGGTFTPLGAVLLGHPAPLPAIEWRIPAPAMLGHEATFSAFRVLSQDVVGFEAFLVESARRAGCSAEEVAAKLCGRWRSNGAPLVLAPTEADASGFAEGDLNRFGYRDEDPDGSRCPLGSHIRRTNPRDAHIVQRGANDVRSVVRRGIPFGPRYDPLHPAEPDAPRGLLGNFICASLSAQFEAMQSDWVNLGLQDPRVTGTNDPLCGTNHPATATFGFATAEGRPVVLHGLPSFVRTLGGAYCFVPTIRAVRWIAGERQRPL